MLWLELARPIVREQGHLLCYATERNKPLGTEAERLGWSEVAEVTYPGPGGDRMLLLYRRHQRFGRIVRTVVPSCTARKGPVASLMA